LGKENRVDKVNRKAKRKVQKTKRILVHEPGGEVRTLAGVRVYGLIGHAFLKEYAWTIDFERRKYHFSK
jgi:hypothetical protein